MFTSFMKLPTEVRRIIQECYSPGETHIPMMLEHASHVKFTYGLHAIHLSWYRSHDYPANAPFLPAVSRMNTELYDDRVKSFLRTTTITNVPDYAS
jgi:hypothetical protein